MLFPEFQKSRSMGGCETRGNTVHRGEIDMLTCPYRMIEGHWDNSNEYVLLRIINYLSPVLTVF